ncbi:MAG: hypothetical protein ABI887_09520 [Burkholderiales bacterium]
MLADREPHTLAGFIDEVTEVVVARQPGATSDHREFTAEAAEL